MKNLIKETSYFTLHILADGIYAAMAKPGQGAWSNAGIVDLGEEVLVFDSLGTPSAGIELRRQAEEITGKPVKYLVNSHYHGDHVFGNQAFKDVPIIATSETLRLGLENQMGELEKEEQEMRDYLLHLKNQQMKIVDEIMKASFVNQYEEIAKLLEDLPILEIILPTFIFEEKLMIRGTKRQVEIVCYGGGHTPSDTFMYIPDVKIAFMGDLLTERLHLPIVDPIQLQTILQSVKQMEIETYVPGHGNAGDQSLCEDLLHYLSFLMDKAKEAHEKNEDMETFLSRLEMPKEFADWKGINGIRANLMTAYRCGEI
ncbi:MBL fold metallo-hydrolase [Pradoshia sp.]|uniref:MBL fold metallo-hydrolase n=1 Tax=Pradoshia sp. TaxID=2651281 RepID=UPI003F01DF04